MDTIKVLDKTFRPSISAEKIEQAVAAVANKINRDYAGKEPMFVVILNGAFMFASDLMKHIDLPCTISFVKLSSYSGTSTTGQVRELIGLNADLTNKDVIIIEDIVDTGTTMHGLLPQFKAKGVNSVEICTLLNKQTAREFEDVQPKYIAIEIPNEFIVGYGLDYDQYGRNLKEIYTLNKD